MSTKNTTATSKAAKPATKGQLAKAAQLFGTEAVKQAEVAAKPAPKADPMAQFVAQQLTTPVALTDERKKEFAAKMDAIQKEFGVALKPVEAKVAKVKVQQNGVTRPADNTKCGAIFAAADKITADTGSTATIAAVKVACLGINDHTIKTQYARWRMYNGIVGRIAAPAPKAAVVMNHEGNP